MKNIYLIGFMGTGKSTVASCLTTICKMDILEMDEQIATEENMSIPEIFEKHGEDYFRTLETKLLSSIANMENKVVSCGGGVVLREENVSLMRENGVVVWLTASPETILERVMDDDNRPLLQGNKNVDYIRAMIKKRQKYYENAAHVVVATDGKNVEEICKEILGGIEC